MHLGRRREADGVLGAWGQTSQVGLWVVEGHFGKLCHKYLGFCEAGSFLRVDKTCVGGKRRLCTSLKSRTAIENLTTLITGCESWGCDLGQAESVRGGAGQSGGEERTRRWESRETWKVKLLNLEDEHQI